MPNLLVHFGVQGLLGRALVARADLRWILLGALLPDCAWILHRVLCALSGLDPIDLRAYAIVQASLALCLVLAGGLALVSGSPGKVFVILASGSFLHLVLDASQTKWGNGVHLFAPASWRLWNAGWYWPESLSTAALTLAGAVWVLWAWRRSPGERVGIRLPLPGWRRVAAGGLLFVYLALPPLFFGAVDRADAHFVGTLRDTASRGGKHVEFDRARYERTSSTGILRIWTREELRVVRGGPPRSGVVSVRARFADAQTLVIEEVHVHAGRAREVPTYLGLLVLLAVWVAPPRSRNAPPAPTSWP